MKFNVLGPLEVSAAERPLAQLQRRVAVVHRLRVVVGGQDAQPQEAAAQGRPLAAVDLDDRVLLFGQPDAFSRAGRCRRAAQYESRSDKAAQCETPAQAQSPGSASAACSRRVRPNW